MFKVYCLRNGEKVYLCTTMVMHVEEIKALAQRAHGDIEVRERLFHTMLCGEGKEASNAAWALTHLPVSDNGFINEHREELVQLAVNTPEVPLRRLSMALLERLEWGVDDVRTDLLDFCLEHMVLGDETYGVRSLCMKLAYYQCRHYPELKEELRQTLMLIEPTELGSGVKHTWKKTLERL